MTLSLFEQVVEAIRCKYLAIRDDDASGDGLPSLEDAPGEHPGMVSRRHWCVGRLQAVEHKTPPFVCWIRGGGTIEAPRPRSQVISDDDVVAEPLYTAEQVVSLVICGTSEAEAECMWFALLRATRELLGAHAGPQEFRFTTQEEEQAAHINAGREVILQLFDWPFIVPGEAYRRATILTTRHSDELHGAAGGTHTTEAHPDPEED